MSLIFLYSDLLLRLSLSLSTAFKTYCAWVFLSFQTVREADLGMVMVSVEEDH